MKEIYQQASVHAHPHTHAEAHGGKDILKNSQKNRRQQRGINGFCTKFSADKNQSKCQQYDIHHHGNQRYGKWYKITQNNG